MMTEKTIVVNLKRPSRSVLSSKVATSKKNAKRKRSFVDTYIYLQGAELADSEDDEETA